MLAVLIMIIIVIVIICWWFICSSLSYSEMSKSKLASQNVDVSVDFKKNLNDFLYLIENVRPLRFSEHILSTIIIPIIDSTICQIEESLLVEFEFVF